jgi:predicted ABC-type transport system involved in lysophospholipase L1 biosynthesis ATPase subunit
MNLLGCLDTPTSGEYILNGIDVSKMEDDYLAEIRNKRSDSYSRHLTSSRDILPLRMLPFL